MTTKGVVANKKYSANDMILPGTQSFCHFPGQPGQKGLMADIPAANCIVGALFKVFC